jgi:hypothetical protein
MKNIYQIVIIGLMIFEIFECTTTQYLETGDNKTNTSKLE